LGSRLLFYRRKVRTPEGKVVAGFTNYDKSEFASPSALHDDDEALEKIWDQQYKLQEFVSADQFKSYDELKSRLDMVLTGGARGGDVADSAEDVSAEVKQVRREQFKKNEETDTNRGEGGKTDNNDEDDALAYFERLANES
jgi:hypothetical protein